MVIAELVRHAIAEEADPPQDEESDLFPASARPAPGRTWSSWPARWRRPRRRRAEPAAPDRPPVNRMPAPGTRLVDRMRDALSGRPTTMEELREKS
ncbi:hypothetical protein O7598_27180 [Micromonospora sp. WMMC241]|uniref:hypothetical protein n=1 Tax=Micromonospora sp. WMMC241 TaxID=3015159 RepID=UPI0022B65F11|nr:hypothetical protein [Micromonospora sp. WMMC241]MCZ7440114.1 hypothetical protein [Micromonospora sp. WMMC241]